MLNQYLWLIAEELPVERIQYWVNKPAFREGERGQLWGDPKDLDYDTSLVLGLPILGEKG